MRLTLEQQQTIRDLVTGSLGEGVGVLVFGSRLDNSRRGGDLDLLLECPQHVPLLARAALKLRLEQELSMPVDLLFSEPGRPATDFESMARGKSQRLVGRL